MSVSIKLEPKSEVAFYRALQKMVDVVGETASDVMRQQGRLLCADFSYHCRPRGKSAADAKAHRMHIAEWISYIYRTPQEAFSKLKHDASLPVALQFLRNWKRRNYAECEKILTQHSKASWRWKIGPFDGGKLHKDEEAGKRLSTVLVLIPGQKAARNAYIRKIQARVGFAKSGFASAAEMLGGTRGFPAWVKKNAGPGFGSVTRAPGGRLILTIENRVRHIRPALDRSGERYAIKFRTKQMQKTTLRIAARKMKSKNLK